MLSDKDDSYLYKIKGYEVLYRLAENFYDKREAAETPCSALSYLLLQLRTGMDLSKIILKYSNYIPLRMIANEIVEENEKLKNQFDEFSNGNEREYFFADVCLNKRVLMRFNNLVKKIKNCRRCSDADESYIRYLLLLERSILRQISVLMRYSKNDEQKKIIDVDYDLTKSRVNRLDYLLKACK